MHFRPRSGDAASEITAQVLLSKKIFPAGLQGQALMQAAAVISP